MHSVEKMQKIYELTGIEPTIEVRGEHHGIETFVLDDYDCSYPVDQLIEILPKTVPLNSKIRSPSGVNENPQCRLNIDSDFAEYVGYCSITNLHYCATHVGGDSVHEILLNLVIWCITHGHIKRLEESK